MDRINSATPAIPAKNSNSSQTTNETRKGGKKKRKEKSRAEQAAISSHFADDNGRYWRWLNG